MSDLRAAILNADDLVSEDVTVAEWGNVKLRIISMTGTERAGYMQAAWDEEAERIRFERIYPELIIATAHDPETGAKVFQAADRDALNTKNSAALERVAQVAMRLSGMDKDAEKRGKADSATDPSDEPTS